MKEGVLVVVGVVLALGFQTPLGVAVQSSGNVLVVDHFGRRIEVFDRNGNYLSELTAAGDRPFNNTWAVAVDGFDNIYV
jgi:tripartite motif-containing protein 71